MTLNGAIALTAA